MVQRVLQSAYPIKNVVFSRAVPNSQTRQRSIHFAHSIAYVSAARSSMVADGFGGVLRDWKSVNVDR